MSYESMIKDAVDKMAKEGGETAKDQPQVDQKSSRFVKSTDPLNRFLRYAWEASKDKKDVEDVIKSYGDAEIGEMHAHAKSVRSDLLANGGALVPEELSAQFIDFLIPASSVRALGAVSIPMGSGNLRMAFGDSASSSSYAGEVDGVNASEPTFGDINLVAKRLTTLVPASNQFLRYTGGQGETILRNQMVRSQAAKEDVTFLRSDGSSDRPRGMYWLAKDQNHVFSANATVSLQNTTDELAKCIRQVEEENIAIERGGWIFAPRVKWYLMTLRDGNGNLVYEPEMRGGTLMGYPFRTSTQIPTNLGGGSDETEVYFADFAKLMIGESMGITLEASGEASYLNSSGAHVSAFARDETVIKATAYHDFNAQLRGKEISVIEACTWGA